MNLAVGTSLVVPKDCHKLMVTEKFGGLRIDYHYLCMSMKGGKPEIVLPAYIKVYEEFSNVLLLLPGIKEILEYTSGVSGTVTPLKRKILDIVVDEMDQGPAKDAVAEWHFAHKCESLTNDEVTGLSDMNDPVIADYPWNMGNFATTSMQFYMKERAAKAPLHVLGQLEDLSPTVSHWSAGNSPLEQALEEVFGVHSCTAFDTVGPPRLVNETVHSGKLSFQDVIQLASPRGARGEYPTMEINKEISFTNLTVFSAEILKLCVWLHQSVFSELSFKTILPNGRDLMDIRLLKAICQNTEGADLEYMGLELSTLFQTWDSATYKEVIVTKTLTDEVFVQLIGRHPSLNQNWYIDLFFTSVLSQALIRQV